MHARRLGSVCGRSVLALSLRATPADTLLLARSLRCVLCAQGSKSSVLFIPRPTGSSIPIALRGAQLTLHTNFLSEGKCCLRIKTPKSFAVYCSRIETHQLQAAVHLINAVSDARTKKSVIEQRGHRTGVARADA